MTDHRILPLKFVRDASKASGVDQTVIVLECSCGQYSETFAPVHHPPRPLPLDTAIIRWKRHAERVAP